MIQKFLDSDDYREAILIQKRLRLTDFQVSRSLALFHYKNKNESEQQMIEEKLNAMKFDKELQRTNQMNKFYLTLLSEAISRFDTNEVSRILNIYSKSRKSLEI